MPSSNFKTFLMATLAMHSSNRDAIERDFIERYQRAAADSGTDYAEALARAEVMHLLINENFAADGAEYLKSHLH